MTTATPWIAATRWPAAVLTALGTMTSGWALTPLFRETLWVPTAAVLILTVLVSGVLARSWFTRRWPVVAVQTASVVLVTGWLFHQPLSARIASEADTLWFGLPSPATVGAWGELILDAAAVLRSSTSPVPVTPGIVFLLSVSIGLLALAADVIGVSLALPALAGLPMLAPYLTAVANSNGALPWGYFVAAALGWLLVLVEADRVLLSRWQARPDPPPTPPGASDPSGGATGRIGASRWSAAAAVGGSALVVAILAAQLLPQLPVRYLAEGLGRGGLGGGGRVGFSTSLDLRTSLRASDQSAVLRYRTDDPSPGPLRVLVSDRFTGDGWEHQPPDATPTTRPTMPPSGFEDRVPTLVRSLSVERTDLDSPHAAAPFGLTKGSMTDAQWAIDRRTGVIVVDRTPTSYQLEYVVPDPTPAQLQEADTPLARWDRERASLSIDQQDEALIENALIGVVPDRATPYQAAVRIQDWLRSPAFTYSLDGVPEPQPSGSTRAPGQPSLLARFLQSKRGYCTHFATTMVLAARARGIPARMAYGFLPGTRVGEGYEVRQSDAHAWPELYFPAIGWLRFEPTPSQRSGVPPAWAPGRYGATTGPTLPSEGATTSAEASPTDAASTASAQRDREGALGLEEQDAQAQGPWWWPLPLAMLGLGMASLVMPVAARAARRRSLAAAADAAGRAEIEWDYLTSTLADLGLRPEGQRTLTEQQEFYRHAAVLDPEQQQSLRTVTQTLERARYAPPGTSLPDIGAQADAVRRAASELRPWWQRARAWWWPSYAVTTLRRRLRIGARPGPSAPSVPPLTSADSPRMYRTPASSDPAERPRPR
ncbi:MAG: transglutaminase domain-containing protein [Austwickia sp.]|nr:transglutaminase domain-containing protein [Austwickia sp.]MBK9100692.1 transglutaminase domain-containing protein [Austwickia sp.]